MSSLHFPFTGLSDEQVRESARLHGYNRIRAKRENPVLTILKDLLKEPMLLLLLAAAAIYFVSGKTSDGLFMVAAILLVTAISLYQESRSRNALEALKALAQPACRVIRNGQVSALPGEELVTGDLVISEEGTIVPADGSILQSNDFSVNESVLTGESLPVFKNPAPGESDVYQGSLVSSGLAIYRVTAIGSATRLGQIGSSLAAIREEATPLQRQVTHFVQRMALVGILVFAVVWAINFAGTRDWMGSLLQSLTLAMSILPEEIPVAFTTFMALGAWRLMKAGIIVKQTKTVETLGSATVICTDKTGTLTTNHMALAALYTYPEGRHYSPALAGEPAPAELVQLAMWASEPIPFDPMETALHEAYENITETDKRKEYHMVHEYPIGGQPPMMTHIFENATGHRIIAAKGAPEALLDVSVLEPDERAEVEMAVRALSAKGYRVLGVGTTDLDGTDFPERQQQFRFRFKGLVAFYDPPKENIAQVLQDFYRAGIRVKIITGDNALTTQTIASLVGFRGAERSLSGEELMRMPEAELEAMVGETQVFTRMFPEAKLRIINALKANREVVAMTGDGVNDGPALKAAHIGIAMGQRGSEIAKQAASLVLTHDDLGAMVEAVAVGRKIYSNLKKAIRYIISIHIPIILTVFLPLALGWAYPNIFTPVHVIFLELIMGPTCSIIYENEPMEKNTMLQPPRPLSTTFFNGRELLVSIVQGLVITAGTLGIYLYALRSGGSENEIRTAVFLTLITANVFLTLVNRSFYFSLLTTLRYRNRLLPAIILATAALTALLMMVPALAGFFSFAPIGGKLVLVSILAGMLSVSWFEAVKAWKRGKENRFT